MMELRRNSPSKNPPSWKPNMSFVRTSLFIASVACPLLMVIWSMVVIPQTNQKGGVSSSSRQHGSHAADTDDNLWGIDTKGPFESTIRKADMPRKVPPPASDKKDTESPLPKDDDKKLGNAKESNSKRSDGNQDDDSNEEDSTLLQRLANAREPPNQSTLVYPDPPAKPKSILNFPIHDVIGDVPDSDKKHDITAAVCHKTLFGEIDMFMVYEWVVYHRMLGFDHFFISYIEPVRDLPHFDLLEDLPYVTFFQNNGAHIIHVEMEDRGNPGYMKNYTRLGGSNNQRVMEAQCTDHDAAEYDWVYLADADEYLWWDERVGVKDFLAQYHNDYDYLSFGKQMYTYYHKVENTKPTFALADFPFTGGNYCLKRDPDTNLAREDCPKDRSKLIVKPSVHKGGINVHGNHVVDKRDESYHFPTSQAHCKEWNSANMPNVASAVRAPKNWLAHEIEEVNIHGFELSYRNADGAVEMIFDKELASWFDFVASRGSSA